MFCQQVAPLVVLFLHNVTAFVAMFVSAVNGSFFPAYSFLAQCAVPCTAVLQFLWVKGLHLNLGTSLWRRDTVGTIVQLQLDKQNLRASIRTFQGWSWKKIETLCLHFFPHSVYQCFCYSFHIKFLRSSPINSPNHNHLFSFIKKVVGPEFQGLFET